MLGKLILDCFSFFSHKKRKFLNIFKKYSLNTIKFNRIDLLTRASICAV